MTLENSEASNLGKTTLSEVRNSSVRAPVGQPNPTYAIDPEVDRRFTNARKVKAIACASMPAEEFTDYKVRVLVNNTDLDGPD